MALINCPECDKQISDKAQSCPGCGVPLNQDKSTCPKCGSHNISANKTGFSGTKAIAGNLIVGPAGLLAGATGSKLKLTCLNCGHEFNPGEKPQLKPSQISKETVYVILTIFAVLILIVISKFTGK